MQASLFAETSSQLSKLADKLFPALFLQIFRIFFLVGILKNYNISKKEIALIFKEFFCFVFLQAFLARNLPRLIDSLE